MRYPSRPSKRAIRNQLQGLAALHKGITPTFEAAPTPRGPQPEGDTNKAIAKWRNLKPGLMIERNKRRLATPVGYDRPIMLGWDCDGSADWIGWQSVVITPAMLGRRIAAFVAIEAKRADGGTVQPNQESFLNALKDAGGIAGVARNAQDAEDVLARWHERVTADER
jgi:hypothetical protein